MNIVWFAVAFLSCTFFHPSLAEEVYFGPYTAQYLGTVDGDTIDVLLHVYPGIDITTRIRERSIDAPEVRGGTPCEKLLAHKATAYMQQLMEGAHRVTVEELGFGTFQPRMVGRLYVDARPVGSLIKEKGLAVDYKDRETNVWCRS